MGLYPTLCELTGLETPNHFEGISLKPLLENPHAAWDTPAVLTYGFQNHSVRTERWRLIRYVDGGQELYDHDKDPNEFANVAGLPEHQELIARLAKQFPVTNKPRIPEAAYPGCFGNSYRGVGKAPPMN